MKLKNLAGDQDTLIEEPWKLGCKFGGFKKSTADEFIIKKYMMQTKTLKKLILNSYLVFGKK